MSKSQSISNNPELSKEVTKYKADRIFAEYMEHYYSCQSCLQRAMTLGLLCPEGELLLTSYENFQALEKLGE